MMNQYFAQQSQPIGQNLAFQQPYTGYRQKQEVPRPNGIEGAYQLPLSSDIGSIIAVDSKQPIAYLITVNGINRTVEPYDMVPHVKESVEPVEVLGAPSHDDKIDRILDTVSSLTDKINDMEVRLDELSTAKDNTGRTKSGKQYSNGNGSINSNGSNAKSN